MPFNLQTLEEREGNFPEPCVMQLSIPEGDMLKDLDKIRFKLERVIDNKVGYSLKESAVSL